MSIANDSHIIALGKILTESLAKLTAKYSYVFEGVEIASFKAKVAHGIDLFHPLADKRIAICSGSEVQILDFTKKNGYKFFLAKGNRLLGVILLLEIRTSVFAIVTNEKKSEIKICNSKTGEIKSILKYTNDEKHYVGNLFMMSENQLCVFYRREDDFRNPIVLWNLDDMTFTDIDVSFVGYINEVERYNSDTIVILSDAKIKEDGEEEGGDGEEEGKEESQRGEESEEEPEEEGKEEPEEELRGEEEPKEESQREEEPKEESQGERKEEPEEELRGEEEPKEESQMGREKQGLLYEQSGEEEYTPETEGNSIRIVRAEIKELENIDLGGRNIVIDEEATNSKSNEVEVTLYNLITGKATRLFGSYFLADMTVMSNGRVLIQTSNGFVIGNESFKTEFIVQGSEDFFVVYLPHQMLAICHADIDRIDIYDLRTLKLVKSLKLPIKLLFADCSPSGELVVSSENGEIIVYK